ncbi:unnamed protein product [Rhizophagus irregularis]|nr:unnamed protein product [Rhizophagus irregularis]
MTIFTFVSNECNGWKPLVAFITEFVREIADCTSKLAQNLAANCLGVSLAFLNWYLLRARARRTSSSASKRASYSSWVSSDAPLIPHWTLQPPYAFFLYGHVPNVSLPFQLA